MSVGRIIRQGIQQPETPAPPPRIMTTSEPPTVNYTTRGLEGVVMTRSIGKIDDVELSASGSMVVRCFLSPLPHPSSLVTTI